MSAKFVTVATFSQPVEAHLARTKLESEGVTCFVSDENVVTVNWLLSSAVGGVKLKVPEWQADYAREVLRPKPRLVVVADNDTDRCCPRCRSVDVYYQRFSRRAGFLAMVFLGFLIPWFNRPGSASSAVMSGKSSHADERPSRISPRRCLRRSPAGGNDHRRRFRQPAGDGIAGRVCQARLAARGRSHR